MSLPRAGQWWSGGCCPPACRVGTLLIAVRGETSHPAVCDARQRPGSRNACPAGAHHALAEAAGARPAQNCVPAVPVRRRRASVSGAWASVWRRSYSFCQGWIGFADGRAVPDGARGEQGVDPLRPRPHRATRLGHPVGRSDGPGSKSRPWPFTGDRVPGTRPAQPPKSLSCLLSWVGARYRAGA